MAVIFLGRPGIEHYIELVVDAAGAPVLDENGVQKTVNKTKPDQQFSSGVMIFRESFAAKVSKGWEDVKGPDGKPLLLSNGLPQRREVFAEGVETMNHAFTPADIGKPYDKFKDEAAILAKYPTAFKKV